jgi:cbb3-type cytochrome oxidase cytochrome c subunit
MNRNRIIYTLGSAVILLIVILGLVQTSSEGRKIFMREGCSNCHSFKGHGGALGPDLTVLSQKRSGTWIMSQIKDPKSHNPASRMPDYAHLSLIERYAIARYLKD